MAILISDTDAFDKLVCMEGERWRKLASDAKNEYGFRYALNTWIAYVEEAETFDPEYAKTERFKMEGIGVVIYGEGGWNRYYVRGSGEIVFSKHHSSSQEKVDKAKEIGFGIC